MKPNETPPVTQTIHTAFGVVLLSDEQALLNIPYIQQFLSGTYWAKNIPLEVVERSVRNSLPVGVYLNGQQVGFARLVTDCTTFAYLADVFVDESQRGRGFSKLLMAFIHAHPQLQGLRRWMLGTKDAHGLYSQFGWSPLAMPERFMQIHIPNVYNPG